MLEGTFRVLGLPLVNHLQQVAFENARDLVARVDCPRAEAVELGINLPMRQRPTWLLLPFVSQREVVMSIGVGRSQLYRGAVGGNGFVDTARLVEHVA